MSNLGINIKKYRQKKKLTQEELAIKSGMTPMLQDGLNKVKQGITTIEEVIRVTKE